MFDYVMPQGNLPVKGFYGVVNGHDVVFWVAKQAKGKKILAGEIVTAIKPTKHQINMWNLK